MRNMLFKAVQEAREVYFKLENVSFVWYNKLL